MLLLPDLILCLSYIVSLNFCIIHWDTFTGCNEYLMLLKVFSRSKHFSPFPQGFSCYDLLRLWWSELSHQPMVLFQFCGISWWFPCYLEIQEAKCCFPFFCRGWVSCDGSHNHRIGSTSSYSSRFGDFLSFLRLTLKCDNKTALQVAASLVFHERIEHIDKIVLLFSKTPTQDSYMLHMFLPGNNLRTCSLSL